ncbi:MAG: hypothetical protein HY553_12760 [Elusimicrobia bacterium]|nr:hypothetical protein [Elusimicrobiota bacterium]
MPREPVWRSKAAFWALVAAFVALAGVPSVVLVQSIQRYVSFFTGVDSAALKSTTTRSVPHRAPRGADDDGLPAMRFVEFKLRAPNAKQVLLAGDFNQWRPETLPLEKASGGFWHTLLPLPPGRYSYLFQVDGAWTPDPEATQGGSFEGKDASLKEVP